MTRCTRTYTAHQPEFYDNAKTDFIHYNSMGATEIAERLAEFVGKSTP